MQKLKSFFKLHHKGQSFLELAIVMLFLLALLFSMVEFGNLLNQYITLVDGAREGARWGSNDDPLQNVLFFHNIDLVIEGDPSIPNSPSAINPLHLDPATDDILINCYSIDQGARKATLIATWAKYGHHVTQVSTDMITARLNDDAPSTGIVVVEIFYQYPQIFSFFRNEINLHTYAIMPLSAAEPTATP